MKRMIPAGAAIGALLLLVGASTASADDTGQPCPTIVQISSASATLVCDDGTATFDVSAMTLNESYQPLVKAGSHTVHGIIVVGDEFRVVYDDAQNNADGSSVSRITILNTTDGSVRQMGY